MKHFLTALLILQFSLALAQEYFPKNDGVKTPKNGYVALTGARIVVTLINALRRRGGGVGAAAFVFLGLYAALGLGFGLRRAAYESLGVASALVIGVAFFFWPRRKYCSPRLTRCDSSRGSMRMRSG